MDADKHNTFTPFRESPRHPRLENLPQVSLGTARRAARADNPSLSPQPAGTSGDNSGCFRFGPSSHSLPNRSFGPETGPVPVEYGAGSSGTAGLVLYLNKSHKVEFEAEKARLRKMSHAIKSTATQIEGDLQKGGFRYRAALITLTYRDGEGWSPNDIAGVMNNYRMWSSRRGYQLSGVWVMEQTKKGRPHYHIVLFVPRGVTPPMPDKQGWWSRGTTNCKWARRPVAYIAKYASKMDGVGELPAGARLHGHHGLSGSQIARRRWNVSPLWVRQAVPQAHGVRYVGGWYRDLTTGIEYRSPWTIDSWGGGKVSIRWWGWSEGENIRYDNMWN